MKDPRVVSFSLMSHWTEHNIRVHVLTCVLALQIAHLMRLQAQRVGLRVSVRELRTQLADIGETILIYPPHEAGPKPAGCSPRPPASRTTHPDPPAVPLSPTVKS